MADIDVFAFFKESRETSGEKQISNFNLLQNYPNPFNPSTVVKYGLPEQSFVELKVFDTFGREVAVLVSQTQEAGTYEIKFDANKLESGVYFIASGQKVSLRQRNFC